jgi:hypothetical protein
MTLPARFPSVGVPSLPPVTPRAGRLAPLCSLSAPRRFPAPGGVLRTAARATVAFPTRRVRLRDGTCGSIPTIGSAPQTR